MTQPHGPQRSPDPLPHAGIDGTAGSAGRNCRRCPDRLMPPLDSQPGIVSKARPTPERPALAKFTRPSRQQGRARPGPGCLAAAAQDARFLDRLYVDLLETFYAVGRLPNTIR